MILVYIPGLVSDARVWRPVADRVGGAHRHADLSGSASIKAMAEAVLAQVDGDLVPVGHSMGGRVAMEMAALAPDRIRGLVLADTGHHPLAPGETAKREARIALGYRDMAGLVAEWLPPMVDPARHDDRALMDDLAAMVMEAGPDRHARQVRALVGRPDAAPGLRKLGCPVLLLVGAADRWSPLSRHEEIAAMVPGPARVVEVPGAGHFLPVERPADTAAAIREWLAATGLDAR